MDHLNNHPKAEKLQTKFHNQSGKLAHIKKLKEALDSYDKKAEYAELQHEFKIREQFSDIEHEFETQYEQLLTNISGKRIRGTRY